MHSVRLALGLHQFSVGDGGRNTGKAVIFVLDPKRDDGDVFLWQPAVALHVPQMIGQSSLQKGEPNLPSLVVRQTQCSRLTPADSRADLCDF